VLPSQMLTSYIFTKSHKIYSRHLNNGKPRCLISILHFGPLVHKFYPRLNDHKLKLFCDYLYHLLKQFNIMMKALNSFSFNLTLLLIFSIQVLSTGTGYHPAPKHDPYPASSPQPLPKCDNGKVE
jgi:hypothetical protein